MKRMAFLGPMSDIADNTHSLLEPQSPAFSNVTVRRAFIVWMYCGQRNKFKDVCNYYHHLESLEDQLSPERRAQSRHHEFNLFSKQPPTSAYLMDNFPQLYKKSYIETHYTSTVEEIKNEKGVLGDKLEGINKIAPKSQITTQDIVAASRMIRKYCRIQMISLKKFQEEFKQHASKCGLNYTVANVGFYIKRKLVQAEIELEANYPKTLGFLMSNSVENIFNDIKENTSMTVDNDKIKLCPKSLDNNFKPVKILRNDDCRKANTVESTKKFWNCKNTELNNTFVKNDIKIAKHSMIDDVHNLMKEGTLMNDFTDDNLSKKERRFSGSYFRNADLERFRKI